MTSEQRIRKPAMRDVAALAGVSHQTVSRVLNDHPNVSAPTKARVREAITALGYRPNTSARALVTNRTGIIGVITDSSGLFGPTGTLVAIEMAAREAAYFVSVASVQYWSFDEVNRGLEQFSTQGVDGVVVLADNDAAAEAVRSFESQIPIVMIAADESPTELVRTVGVDQRLGARLAVRHLVELGHTKIAHITGPLDWFDARARVEGWKEELALAGLEPPSPIVGDWSAERGYEVALELIDSGLPTAVFAANDQLSLGLLHAFAEHGVRVPLDISVVGFDDSRGAAHFWPPLTTVSQEFHRLGRECLRIVLAMIDGDLEPDVRPIEPRLVIRQSTGSPKR